MTYRPDIDGLRAIAILLVVVFHFDLFAIGKAGFIGVDVFFVISGFLITSIIVADLKSGKFSLRTFYYRRARRLLPAILATLLLYWVAGYFLLLPDIFEEFSVEAVLSQVYVSNFYYWRTVNYFGFQAAWVPLLHTWSLAVEEQFYIFFPLLCLVVWRLRPGFLLPALVIGLSGSFALGLVATPWKPTAAFYLLPTRAWELLAGAVLSLLITGSRFPRAVTLVVGPVGLMLIAGAVAIHAPYVGIPGWFSLLPTLGAVLLILSGTDERAPVTVVLSSGPMVWIGLISYPLYLVHWPVLILLKENVELATLPLRIAGFVMSFVIAAGIYYCVEKPIRSRSVLADPRTFLAAAFATTGALFALCAVAIYSDGLPGRFQPEVARALSYAEDTAKVYRGCQGAISDDKLASVPPACHLGDQDARPTMLVVGDSMANAFAQSIDLWLKRSGEKAVFSFQYACLPVPDLGVARCTDHSRNALTAALDNPEIDTVLFVSIWRQPFEADILHDGAWKSGEPAMRAFTSELVETARVMSENGKQLVLIEPFFGTPASVPRRLARNLAFGSDWPLDTPLETHQSVFAPLFDSFDAAEASGARRISLLDEFCTDGLCRGVYDGLPVFSDADHIAASMSETMSRIFEDRWNALER